MNLRLRFWIKMHKFVDRHYEQAMHKHFTNVPPGMDPKKGIGVIDDPPGTPPEQISILSLEKVYDIPDED